MGSQITPRCCSTPFDFASDVPFHDVPAKLREHYGFELSPEIIRRITLCHAQRANDFVKEADSLPDSPGVEMLIAEADGGMIPIVTFDENSEETDKRKTRQVCWREARLCFSRDVNNISGIFRATLQSTNETGDMWFSTAVEAGMGSSTKVHCIGDGALWIKEQSDRIFADQGSYLVDFYHVSDYLAAASPVFNKDSPREWLHEQQKLLKEGNLYLVLQNLERHLYGNQNPEEESVRSCYR